MGNLITPPHLVQILRQHCKYTSQRLQSQKRILLTLIKKYQKVSIKMLHVIKQWYFTQYLRLEWIE